MAVSCKSRAACTSNIMHCSGTYCIVCTIFNNTCINARSCMTHFRISTIIMSKTFRCCGNCKNILYIVYSNHNIYTIIKMNDPKKYVKTSRITFYTITVSACNRSIWTYAANSANRQTVGHNTCLRTTTRISDNTWILTTLIYACMLRWTISIYTTLRFNRFLS